MNAPNGPHEFCDDCPGCRPCMVDVDTGQKIPEDHPYMVTVLNIWKHATSYAQRRAYIQTTLNGSKDLRDLTLANQVIHLFVTSLHKIHHEQKTKP